MKISSLVFLVVMAIGFPIITQAQWQQEQETSSRSDGPSSNKTDQIAKAPNGDIYIMRHEETDTNLSRLVVASFDGTSWAVLPSPGYTTSNSPTGIEIDNNNQPYILYMERDISDSGDFYDVYVKTYNGVSWQNVGTSSPVLSNVDNPFSTLSLDQNGMPYLSHVGDDGLLEYLRFDGTDWVQVGSTKLGAQDISFPTLKFTSTNVPYTVFGDRGIPRTVLAYFNGSQWQELTSFDSSRTHPSLAIDSNDVPHIMIQKDIDTDGINFEDRSEVKIYKYQNSQTSLVATYVHTGVDYEYLPAETYFDLDTNDIPYISYVTDASNGYGSMKRYVGGAWQLYGPEESIDHASFRMPFIFDQNNIPVVRTFTYNADLRGMYATLQTLNIEGVCRFYSSKFRGHFFTANSDECVAVMSNPDWTFEGVAYDPVEDGTPGAATLYRFWSPNYKHHFYTASIAERNSILARDPNWEYEGVAYNVFATNTTGRTAVYRFWSPAYNGHFYTASATERDSIVANDPNWNYEGIAWYVPQ